MQRASQLNASTLGRPMEVLLRLSDPWEVGEELGWPPVPATVIHVEGEVWLVEINQPFDYEGSNYRYVVISPRHEGASLSQCASQSIPCNMTKTTTERALSASPCDTSWWRGKHAMIGSIEAAQQADADGRPLRGRR